MGQHAIRAPTRSRPGVFDAAFGHRDLIRLGIPLTVAAAYVLQVLVVDRGVGLGGPAGFAPASGGAFQPLLHWDGEWYAGIAAHGYAHVGGPYQPNAFFPLFPAVLAALHGLLPALSLGASAFIINTTALVAALVLVDRALAGWEEGPRRLALLLIVAVPSAFFYVVAYSEALFLLGIALTLWATMTPDRRLYAGLGLFIATLDRPVGALLLVAVLPLLRRQHASRREWILAIAAPAAAIAALLAVNARSAGDPFAFARAQSSWSSLRSLGLSDGVRWVVLQINPATAFQPVFAVEYWELLGALAAVPLVMRWNSDWGRYALVALVTPFLVGGLGTESRYIAPVLPLWIGLAHVTRGRRARVAWPALLLASAGGIAINAWWLHRFAAGVWAG